ncbi:hypothetical protein RchiOBHm_Chr2g0151091 [Rosa chinensis]|uniref:Uncharacterized protein n=1 Tax=Rosa chinensis TaxID=74649 RepID=A0A2P6S032_ROSCH|nr:hypothetical protein RchiOBHm_Chr2g0151081 [Rosa chinensis]PRQ52031.1 hypothetical protein RchiOBHm_Chr2g0151091 [Rosa chinensis]
MGINSRKLEREREKTRVLRPGTRPRLGPTENAVRPPLRGGPPATASSRWRLRPCGLRLPMHRTGREKRQ